MKILLSARESHLEKKLKRNSYPTASGLNSVFTSFANIEKKILTYIPTSIYIIARLFPKRLILGRIDDVDCKIFSMM